MSKDVKSDAKPVPTSEPKVEEPVTPPAGKRRTKKEYLSQSSSDSESEFSSRDNYNKHRGRPAGNVTNIGKVTDLHIGSRYQYNTAVAATYHNYTETNSDSHDSSWKGDKGPTLPEELLNSKRELNTDDMYIVAENISRNWKKLARFLPPKNVFTDGQLRNFEDNNPKDQEEAVYEMLTTWKKRYPEHATIGTIALTLWDIGKGDIAKRLTP